MGFDNTIRPSKEMWEYFKGDITPLKVVCALGDRIGGFNISYSAKELLKDLNLLTKKGLPNKRGRQLVAWYLHQQHFGGVGDLIVIDPTSQS